MSFKTEMNAIYLLLILFCYVSCVNRNQKDYAPKKTENIVIDTVCHPSTPSYTFCIKPLIQANCVSCHSESSTDPYSNPYVLLGEYDVLYGYAVHHYDDRPTSEKELQTHIKALFPNLYAQMPPAKLLNASDIAMIDAWIAAGAPHN